MELETSPFDEDVSEEVEEEAEVETEEEVEETEEETEDESGDETDESDEEPESDEEAEAEPEEDFEKQYNGVKTALFAEREKRKVISETLESLQSELEVVKAQDDGYKEAFEKLVQNLNDDELADLVEIPKIEGISKELIDARRVKNNQQQQEALARFYGEVKTEAESIAPDFKHIDLKDEKQGIVLTHIITLLAKEGKNVGDTVSDGMKLLNSLIKSVEDKTVTKNRVRPNPKPHSRTRSKTNNSFEQKVKKGVETGDFSDAFAQVIGNSLS